MCSASESWPCSSMTAEMLAAHGQAEFLTPSATWDDISDDKWFGADHANAHRDHRQDGTWAKGYYILAFDYNGTCVADGKREEVGKTWNEIYTGSSNSFG